MPEDPETIAECKACSSPMDISAVAPFSNVVCPSCGEQSRVKTQFGPYTLTHRYAVGGMSMVFSGRDSTLNREVAVKILSEDYSKDQKRIDAAVTGHGVLVRKERTKRTGSRDKAPARNFNSAPYSNLPRN